MKPSAPFRLSAAALVLGAASALFLPHLPEFGLTDQDALANIAQIRADRGGLGWPNGFFFVSAGLRCVNAALNGTGLFFNHYLLAYRILVWLCLPGLALGTCLLIARHAGRRDFALLLALVLLTLPGVVRLFVIFEDNLVSALAHLVYLAAFLRLVDGCSEAQPWRTEVRRRFFVYGLFPLSLLLAVLAHRQYVVLWPTPLFLLWLLRPLPLARRARIVLGTYAIAGGCFLAIFAALTWYWDDVLTWAGWLDHLQNWFVPVRVYRGYYFFNQSGWNLAHQAGQVFTGVARLFACAIALPWLSLGLWLVMVAAVLVRSRPRSASADPINQALVLFVAVHIPHSLIYESSNVERWDSLLVPLLVLLARLACRPWEPHEQRSPGALIPILWTMILTVNLPGYAVFTGQMRAASGDPYLQAMLPGLRLNVRPERARDPDRLLLVLDPDEFNARYMFAEAFYSYADALLVLSPDGKLSYSFFCYPNLRPLDPLKGEGYLKGRLIIANPNTSSLLRQFYGLPDSAFASPPPGRSTPASD